MAKQKNSENPMRAIKVVKVTLNIGAGKDQAVLEKGQKLLKQITGIDPVKTKTNKRIAAWGLRPGLPIGVKLTLRKDEALKLIPRLLHASEYKLNDNNFDENGNISFGIKECIDIKDAKYEPEIGIIGLQASITLERPGFRIKKRKLLKGRIPMHHRIPKADAIKFMKENFNVKIISEEEKDE